MQTGQRRASSTSAPAAPSGRTSSSATCSSSTPSITTRATSSVQVGDAARDAHARPRRHRDHARHPRGPALQDPPAPRLRARRRRQGDRAARRPPRTSAQMVRAKTGDYFNRAELVEGSPGASARSTATPATPTSRPSRETELDPDKQRGRHRRPDPARPARLLRAHRDQGQHQDARQGHPPRDGDRGGAALQRDQARATRKRRITALGYFERVDVSTEQGDDARHDQRQLRGRREAHRHVPGRRRLLQHRELHRHRAGPAGEPVRQRPVARAPGAGLRPPAARRHPLLRAVLPRHATGRRRVELYDQLRVYPDFSQPIARRRRSPSATRSSQP